MFQTWQIIVTKAFIQNFTLIHPCNMNKKLLGEIIPRQFDVDEILNLLTVKQKEIARRLNIARLSSDRPSGMLGQLALFEVLRNKGFDFKSYLSGFYDEWCKSQAQGYCLLYALGYLHYVRKFFGCTSIDLVKALIESITYVHLAMTWDQNWYARLTANMLNVTPNYLSNGHIYQALQNLMQRQDGWGMTISRMKAWTGVSQSTAKHLIDVISSGWLEHRYRIVSKNTGLVKVLVKSQSKWKTLPSFFSTCTSLLDGEDYLVTMADVFKKDVKGKYIEYDAINTNIDSYDQKSQAWKLHSSFQDFLSVNDIYSILPTGDHHVPDNSIPPTRRDLLFIALLTAMDTSCYSKKSQEIVDWFTKGYGIPKKEVDKGVRNVLRKNMLRNQYTHFAIMDADRESFVIIFDDASKKVIPFLGDILPNLPISMLHTDGEMSFGLLLDYHPRYFSCDLQTLIETSMREHDVNAEMFILKSWGFGHPGSILELVSDE